VKKTQSRLEPAAGLGDELGFGEARGEILNLFQDLRRLLSTALVDLSHGLVAGDAGVDNLLLGLVAHGVGEVSALGQWDLREADLVALFNDFGTEARLFSGLHLFAALVFAVHLLGFPEGSVVAGGGIADFTGFFGVRARVLVDQVALVELTHIVSQIEFGGAEFVFGFEVIVTAETALNIAIHGGHLDVGRLSIEVHLDTGFGQFADNLGALFLAANDDVFVIHDVLELFRLVFAAVEFDLDRLVLLGFRGQDEAVAAGDDLDFLLLRFLAEFADEDGEFGFFVGAAILGQDGPAGGQRDGIFNIIEGLDGAGADAADGHGVGIHLEDIVEGTNGADATDVHRDDADGERDILEGGVLTGGLDGDVDVLAGLGVELQDGAFRIGEKGAALLVGLRGRLREDTFLSVVPETLCGEIDGLDEGV